MASALEWEGVVYFWSKTFDLVLCEIGSDVFWRIFHALLISLDWFLLDIGSFVHPLVCLMDKVAEATYFQW